MNEDERSEAFDLRDCRTDAERAFAGAIAARARGWLQWGVDADDLVSFPAENLWVLSFDVCAPGVDQILRTLRVEFGPSGVCVGDDFTKQGHPLDSALQTVTTLGNQQDSVSRLAELTADWIERELRRPIEEHEWRGDGFRHRRWILADTGEGLSWSDSENAPRPRLGPPDSVRLVRGEG